MPIIEIDFKCDHCGQEYSQDTFNIAVFLYGIIFLIGNKSGYTGITCPRCLRTITHEGNKDQIAFTRESLSNPIEFQNYQFDLNLRYHSSVNYFPKTIKSHKDIDIYFLNNPLPTEDLDSLHSHIYWYEDESNLCENYFCTYAFDDAPPMGSFLSIGWFEENLIHEVIQIENEKSLRIFPRYVPMNSVYEDIEQFCWDYYLYLNYLKEEDDEAYATIHRLKEIAKQNDIDFKDLLKDNPDILMPKDSEYIRNRFVNQAKNRSFRIPTDFMDILAADPHPADLPFPENTPLHYFWKTIHPFRGKEVPKKLIDFDLVQFKKRQKKPLHKKMVDVCKENFNKELTQKSLFTLSNRFIFDYIKLAGKVDFSHGKVWELKERYLKLLYDSISSSRRRNIILNKIPERELEAVQKAEDQFPNVKIISNNSEINQIKIDLSKIAKLKFDNIDILLLGETGTGKELFANAFHESSGRPDDKFVVVNCGSIQKSLFESQFFGHEKGAFTDAKERHSGYFEIADGGTIFLDEIGELDFNDQKRFLRIIENREIQPIGGKSKRVDVKIVYATNRDLNQMVEDGSFRSDLYHRIIDIPFHIPPLRDRKNDIPLLVQHFIEKYDDYLKNNPELKPIRVTDNCMVLLRQYHWPGNVRELQNLIKKIIILRLINNSREEITPSDLPQHILKPVDFQKLNSKPQQAKKNKPTREELIQFKKDGILQKEIAENYGKDPSTVSKWYKGLHEAA